MKLPLFLLLFLLSVPTISAQIYDPISFETRVEEKTQDTYVLKLVATLEDGWHLYSQQVPEDGPIPTSFNFEENENFKLIGKVEEPKGLEVDDPVFEMRIKFFENKATFTQLIKRQTSEAFTVKGSMLFMVCDDQRCLPPESREIVFSIPQQKTAVPKETAAPPEDLDKKVSPQQETQKQKTSPQKETSQQQEASPQQEISQQKEASPQGTPIGEVQEKAHILKADNSAISKEEKKQPLPLKKPAKPSSQGFFSIFFIAFLSGFAALLTPCVFPMIPMTVSYFTKQSKTRAKGIRNAVIYGISIILIYVLLGTLVTVIFGADSLNALSTSVWFNLIFFALLVIFALSFLGAFELVLPNSWGTRIDSKADKGGYIGIFFMALALAIVSFSCTGPIVGTLLVEAASKGGLAPVIGMLGFSLAIALPFALFAAFPGWMNSLPKSGGWLNTVKVCLGFLELALAFKFLSNVDLVLQTHFLEREVFITLWIAIFGVLALYLFGKIRLPHDSPSDHISVGRLSLGIIVLAFTIYLIPGLWGAPLKIISGFPPPMHYSESPEGVGFIKSLPTGPAEILPEGAKYGPHNIVSFLDYEEGMAYAREANKPVLLDFTGHACVNCRKMEERVWPEPKVLELLKNEVVLISLYVDDRRELPESEQYISETTGKKIETIGNKWSDFQIKNYKANAQPYYVIIDHEEENLNEPTGYDPDVDLYYHWLLVGIENFNKGS